MENNSIRIKITLVLTPFYAVVSPCQAATPNFSRFETLFARTVKFSQKSAGFKDCWLKRLFQKCVGVCVGVDIGIPSENFLFLEGSKIQKNFISQIGLMKFENEFLGKNFKNQPILVTFDSAKNDYYVFFNRSIMILCQHHLPCSGIWNALESIRSKIKGIWVP